MDINYWVEGEGPNGVTFACDLPYIGRYSKLITNGEAAAARRSNADLFEKKVEDLLKVYHEGHDNVRFIRS